MCSDGEMADALALGASSFGSESSSLSPSTNSPLIMVFFKKKKGSLQVAEIHFNLEKEKEFSKFIKYLSNPVAIAWRNFLAGAFQGLGILFGTALFLSLLSFILSRVLGEIPFFSDFAVAIQAWMNSVLSAQS